MTLPRVGLDPVMVQTFDMAQGLGAQKMPRKPGLSNDLLPETLNHEWSEWDERHRRQSREGTRRGSGEATEFQSTQIM